MSFTPIANGETGDEVAAKLNTLSNTTLVGTWLESPSSANLKAVMTDETGSGALVFASGPTLVAPVLGTPASGNLANCTGVSLVSGVSGTLPITSGGTGQVTQQAAINALTNVAAATAEHVLTKDTATGNAVYKAVPSQPAPTLPIEIGVAISDETSDLETGTAKITYRVPAAFTLTAVRASVATAPTGAALVVDVNKNGTTVLSTKLSIDDGEKTSQTATTPPVISDSSIADDDEITIDIDQIGSTVAGAGAKVWLVGTRT